MATPTKGNMLYGSIPITVTGKIDLDATAKILAPIFLKKYEADQVAREQRKQLRLVNLGEKGGEIDGVK